MADPDVGTLLSALLSVDKQAKEDSPWNPFSQASDVVGASLLKGSAQPGAKPQDAILAGLLTGLLGGGANALTEQYQGKQDALARQLIYNSAQGNEVTRPDGMSPSVFNLTQNAGQLFKVQRDLSVADDARRLALQHSYDNESQPLSPEVQAVATKIRNGEDLTTADNAVLSGAPLGVQRLVTGVQNQQMLDDRFSQGLDARVNANQDKNTRFEEQRGDTIADRIAKSDPAKHFEEVRINWEAIQQERQQHTQSGAVAAVKAAAKILNPGAIVRESSFQLLTRNPNNFSQQLQDMLSEIKGTGQLSDQHFDELIGAVKPFVSASWDEYQSHMKTQLGTFANFGGAADKVQTLPGPDLGAPATPRYTVEELTAGGYSPAEIAAFQQQGVVK